MSVVTNIWDGDSIFVDRKVILDIDHFIVFTDGQYNRTFQHTN